MKIIMLSKIISSISNIILFYRIKKLQLKWYHQWRCHLEGWLLVIKKWQDLFTLTSDLLCGHFQEGNSIWSQVSTQNSYIDSHVL